MADLKCAATNCTYNEDNYCSKGDIMVGGKHANTSDATRCESFRKRGCNCYTSSVAHPSKTISIDCEADKCVYNSNYKCVAEHVDISGVKAKESMETACDTFKER